MLKLSPPATAIALIGFILLGSFQNCAEFTPMESVLASHAHGHAEARWVVMEWTPCSNGLQTREVICLDENNERSSGSTCDAADLPANEQSCTAGVTATPTPIATPAATPTPAPTPTPTPAPTPQPSASPMPTPMPTPSPTATPTPTATPRPTPTPMPTPTPSPTPSPTPAGDLFEFSVDDPSNLLGTKKDLIIANAVAAGRLWAAEFNANPAARIQVTMKVVSTGNGRFSGASVVNTIIGKSGARWIVEEGTAHEIRTGKDVNGASAPDARIEVDPGYVNNEMWLDPQPALRTATVPSNRLDGVSVMLHELGHALGFNGLRNWQTGELPAEFMGIYDTFITVGANDVSDTFNGTNAVASYGKVVPLAKGVVGSRFYHYGDASTAKTDGLAFNLMTGNYFMYGIRYQVAPIDRAFLKDLGAPVK